VKTFFILLVTFFVSLNYSLADGNEKAGKKSNKINPKYIVSYKYLLTSRFYLLNESIGFQVKPKGAEKGILFKPNIHTKVGLAGFYKWFGFGLAIRSPFYERNEDITLIDLMSTFNIKNESFADLIKVDKCNLCNKNDICAGLRKEYYNKFGDSEIIPYFVNKINSENDVNDKL